MSDNLGATKNEIIEYYQDEVATLGREISAKDQRIAELEQERDEWRTKALDVEKHPVVVALRRERDALAAALEAIRMHVRDQYIHFPGLGTLTIGEYIDKQGGRELLAAHLAAERKAGKVEALKAFGKYLKRLGIEHVDEAAGCAIESIALEAEVLAAQIERGEEK